MSYLGENTCFSFRDNFCEPLPEISVTSAVIADFGRTAASIFNRFAIGCENESQRHLLYSLSAGCAECGKDVFICENTDLPSFKFGIPFTSSDCGIFLSGNDTVRLSFFGSDGYPLNQSLIEKIINSEIAEASPKCGKITPVSSFSNIYINSIKDRIRNSDIPLNAGISCGNRIIRSLWQEFFNDADDNLILQISDDGQRVNAYSTDLGFISYDRLLLAYAVTLWKNGQTVWLPEHFHYAADNAAQSYGFNLQKYKSENDVPSEAAEQRFCNDALFLCTQLLSDRDEFFSVLNELPQFTSAKRDINIDITADIPYDKEILESNGKIYISKSGKNRISLIAQSYQNETAAELCNLWNDKLIKLSSCTNLFHPKQ